jgi:hypothetical protein
VRRSSDNVERDIYGTFRGDLDLAALTSFVGANSGFVTTWYDQSGTGRHATQATAASQPRIVNAGAVDTENGKPAVFFNGTSNSLFNNITLSTSSNSIFSAVRMLNSANASEVVISYGAYDLAKAYGTPPMVMQISDSGIAPIVTYLFADVGVSSSRLHSLINAFSSGTTNSSMYLNGSFKASATKSVLSTRNTFSIGALVPSISGAFLFTNMSAFEFIVYDTNQSSSRTNIESNINNYYKIY